MVSSMSVSTENPTVAPLLQSRFKFLQVPYKVLRRLQGPPGPLFPSLFPSWLPRLGSVGSCACGGHCWPPGEPLPCWAGIFLLVSPPSLLVSLLQGPGLLLVHRGLHSTQCPSGHMVGGPYIFSEWTRKWPEKKGALCIVPLWPPSSRDSKGQHCIGRHRA